MFVGISWSSYFTFLLIAIAGWYSAVWIFVYKAKLPVFTLIPRPAKFELPAHDEEEMARYILEELSASISGKSNKSEVVMAVRQKLKNYDGHTEPAFRNSLNLHIARLCESKCSIRLAESDFSELWS
jgi:hypothetical protein